MSHFNNFVNFATFIFSFFKVDHTIIIYLVDPEGMFVDYYGQTHDVDKVMTSILVNKLKYEQLKNDSSSWLPSLPIKGVI